MTNVHEWDVAAGNNTGSPPAGAPEGMLAGKVNDVMREMMAATARWYQDNRMGSLVSTNSTNAYALTSNQTYAALSDIAVISFRVNAANTGAATLNVDGLGAKNWYKRPGAVAYSSGDLIADQTVQVAYNATDDVFETVGGHNGEFDSGDELVIFQAAASNGWTKDTTANLNDTALRLVTGTPSSSTAYNAFSTTLGSSGLTTTDGTTITSSTMPSHSHGAGTYDVDSHSHTLNNLSICRRISGGFASSSGSYIAEDNSLTTSNSAPDVGGTSSSAGSGNSHAHTIDTRCNHHDVIKQAKD